MNKAVRQPNHQPRGCAMSWNHGTVGFERYESFVAALTAAGIPYAEEPKNEVFVRGWDGSCVCFCGYGPKTMLEESLGELLHMPEDRFEQTLAQELSELEEWMRKTLAPEVLVQELSDIQSIPEDFRRIRRSYLERESCPCCRGTCGHRQHLRIACFTNHSGKQMVVEEYQAVKDYDCDGQDVIAIAVYEEGRRPDLVMEVLEA